MILIVACGCSQNKGSTNAELIAIDSLLSQNRILQASEMLSAMNTEYLNDEDLAYHTLLSAQAGFEEQVAGGDADSIELAVKHYKNSDDREKYARALLYQGYIYGKSGELDKAITCLRKAEDVAGTDDIRNHALAKMMMGELYQSQVVGAKTVGAEKYREALELFTQIDDKHHQIVCLSELGGLYRINREKQDSAMPYINAAIDLAKQEIELQPVVANLYSRAEYRAARGDYQGARMMPSRRWTGVDT